MFVFEVGKRRRGRRVRWCGAAMSLVLLAAVLVAAGTVAAPSASAQDDCGPEHLFRCGYIEVPERQDAPGVLLSYNVRLPSVVDEATGQESLRPGPYPTALIYAGYGNQYRDLGHLEKAVMRAGYAVLMVNVRGSGCSGGPYAAFDPVEAADAKYVIDQWVPAQPWSNGDVAMVGGSYAAVMQLPAAATRPAHLKAIVPVSPAIDLYRDVLYPGGIFNTGLAAYFTTTQRAFSGLAGSSGAAHELEFQKATCAQNQAERSVAPRAPTLESRQYPFDGPYWHERSAATRLRDIDVPVLLMAGWQDQVVGARAVETASQIKKLHAILYNGGHFDADVLGTRALQDQVVDFLDHYVRGVDNGYDAQPRIQVWWELGRSEAGVPGWVTTAAAWPVPQTKVLRYDLAGNGTVPGGGVLAEEGSGNTDGADTYASTPGAGQSDAGIRGVPGTWAVPPKPGSSLTYTTPPLEQDVVALGSASVDLSLSSTAYDTDVQVTLSEVRPDGQEMFVQHGWLRASHRALDPSRSRETLPYHPHTAAEPLEPLVPSELRVEVLPFAHVFRADSRIRLTIEPPKATDTWAFEPQPVAAVNTVHHDAEHRSQLVLGVLPGQREVVLRALPPCGSLHGQRCRPALP